MLLLFILIRDQIRGGGWVRERGGGRLLTFLLLLALISGQIRKGEGDPDVPDSKFGMLQV